MALDLRGVYPLLQIYDMPASIHFYRDLLGFEIVQHSPRLPSGSFHWAMLRLNETEIMLNTAFESDDERPPVPESARVAAHGDTILYFGCPDTDEAYRHLREKGLDVKPPQVAHYGMKQLYLSDPDGYGLCFQWPA
jgi:catechol 2,3-dioxygenase-like lactoylglutathione lyase family enzyme